MDILQKQTISGTGYRTKIDKQKTQHINLKKMSNTNRTENRGTTKLLKKNALYILYKYNII
jgi:hypothetical protein